MNRLRGSRCYLSGSIEHSKDLGQGWRNTVTLLLEKIGVSVVNPHDKPLQNKSLVDEYISERLRWKQRGEFDKIANLKFIRNIDLRLVDVCDWVFCYLNMDEKPFGTIEEIVTANRSKKPVVIWSNNLAELNDWCFWMLPAEMIHGSMQSALQYIRDVDAGNCDHKRWIYLNF